MAQIDYLYTAAISLPSETEAQKVLKSFYMTKSKELFGYDRTARNLKFNPTRTCSRCNTLWSDGGCRISFKERPTGKCKSRRKCRQLVSKHYKYGMPSGRFTRMAKFMARKLCRQVTFQCTLCEYKQIFYMRPKLRKSLKKSSLSLSTVNKEDSSTATGKKRKKKASKTKFGGLNRDVMQNLKTPAVTPTTTTKTEVIKLEVNKKKKDNDKNKNGTKVAKGHAAKMEANSARSKALSKNSMMQLALLLKNKDEGSGGGANRLEMMFK